LAFVQKTLNKDFSKKHTRYLPEFSNVFSPYRFELAASHIPHYTF